MQLQNRLVPAAAVKQMTAKIEGLEDDLHRIVQVGPVGEPASCACSFGLCSWVRDLAFLLGRAGPGDLHTPGGLNRYCGIWWAAVQCVLQLSVQV